jgi:hypothetical protein
MAVRLPANGCCKTAFAICGFGSGAAGPGANQLGYTADRRGQPRFDLAPRRRLSTRSDIDDQVVNRGAERVAARITLQNLAQ